MSLGFRGGCLLLQGYVNFDLAGNIGNSTRLLLSTTKAEYMAITVAGKKKIWVLNS